MELNIYLTADSPMSGTVPRNLVRRGWLRRLRGRAQSLGW